LVREASELFSKAAALLESPLGESGWVTGKNLTLADFSLASMLTYWEKAGVPLQGFPRVHAWYARVGELPCWIETAPKL
jgi:glutathione S-transferase